MLNSSTSQLINRTHYKLNQNKVKPIINVVQKGLTKKQTLQIQTAKVEIQFKISEPNSVISPQKNTQRKSNVNTKTPLKSVMKSVRDSSSLQSQPDKQELFLLEIKQLKRENCFLKKKIKDLTAQYGDYKKQQIKKKNTKGAPKQNVQSLHLSVNLFFQEIKNLLNSVSQLFRLNFSQKQIEQFKQSHPQQITQLCPITKHAILKKYTLNRKLQRVTLQEQSKRYPLLLDIFSEYYQFKQEAQKKVAQTIDEMIMYTNDLNKWLIEKAQSKKMKSQVQSQKTSRVGTTLAQPPKFQTLRVPSINLVSKNRGATLSPATKTNSGQRKSEKSP